MLRLVVLENSLFFRLGIKEVFKGKPDICVAGDANINAALLGLLAYTPTDVVLIGVDTPNDTIYVNVTHHIRRNYPQIKILAIANEGTAHIVQSMIKAGINGFIGKRQANRYELEIATRKIAGGGQYIGKIDSNNYPITHNKRKINLFTKILSNFI